MNRLDLYNEALSLVGEVALASLTEEREPRRLLDGVWDRDGVGRCLEAGQWQFAMRTVQIDYTPSVEPDFGYSRAFDKPSDFVRTAAVCSDEFFQVPLTRYNDEQAFWFADLDTIYVRYVSDDTSYGRDMSLWPGSFAAYTAAYFANGIVSKLTGIDPKTVTFVQSEMKNRLASALAKDAMAEPTKSPPMGSWNRSRRGNRSNRDGGPWNRLV